MENLVDVKKDKQTMELINNSEVVVRDFKDFIVKDNEVYLSTTKHITDLKKRRKEIVDKRVSITRKIDESKKDIMDLFCPAIERIDQTITLIETKALTYRNEQEVIRKKEEDRLLEIQRKKDEKEKERIEKKAAKADEKGDEDRAEDLREQKEQVFTPPAHVPSVVASLPGRQHIRKNWKARILNVNKIPREYFTVNQSMLDSVARARKEEGEIIPGVQFYFDEKIAG